MLKFSTLLILLTAANLGNAFQCYQCLSVASAVSSSALVLIQEFVKNYNNKYNQSIELPPLCGTDGEDFKESDKKTCLNETTTCYNLVIDLGVSGDSLGTDFNGVFGLKSCAETSKGIVNACSTISPSDLTSRTKSINTNAKVSCLSCQEELCNSGAINFVSVAMLLLGVVALL